MIWIDLFITLSITSQSSDLNHIKTWWSYGLLAIEK